MAATDNYCTYYILYILFSLFENIRIIHFLGRPRSFSWYCGIFYNGLDWLKFRKIVESENALCFRRDLFLTDLSQFFNKCSHYENSWNFTSSFHPTFVTSLIEWRLLDKTNSFRVIYHDVRSEWRASLKVVQTQRSADVQIMRWIFHWCHYYHRVFAFVYVYSSVAFLILLSVVNKYSFIIAKGLSDDSNILM